MIPAAERVPVEVRLRPCAVPETTRSVPVTVDDEEMVPVTFTAADEVIPAAERVPVMSTGPLTTRLDVLMLEDVSVLFAPTISMFSEEVKPAVESVPVMSTGQLNTR